MLTNTLKVLVNNPIKKKIYDKKGKKINILTTFFSFSIKMISKHF